MGASVLFFLRTFMTKNLTTMTTMTIRSASSLFVCCFFCVFFFFFYKQIDHFSDSLSFSIYRCANWISTFMHCLCLAWLCFLFFSSTLVWLKFNSIPMTNFPILWSRASYIRALDAYFLIETAHYGEIGGCHIAFYNFISQGLYVFLFALFFL